jgi:hypothetical protein
MTPDDKALRLQETWAEQAENLRMLARAATQLEANALRLGAWSATPTDAERDVQDRFIFRYSKTVDAMRKRLFPQLLDYAEELDGLPTLRDRLNRLEKYGLLETDAWIELGLRRTAFGHDDPDPARREASLKQAFDSLPTIHCAMGRARDWLESRFGLALPAVNLTCGA